MWSLTRLASALGNVNMGHFIPDYTAYEELLSVFKAFSAAWWTRKHLNWIYRRRSRRKNQLEPEDGLTADERYFLQTHAAAMLAAMTGWFVFSPNFWAK